MASVFSTLTENLCKFITLYEAMSVNQAVKIFLQYGVDVDRLDGKQLEAAWKNLVKKYHPDRPENNGDSTPLALINAAYDELKNNAKTFTNHDPHQSYNYNYSAYQGVPEWQTDKRSSNNTIRVESFRDPNFIKKKMWELSEHSKNKYTIHAYDGHFFRGVITVFGSYDIYKNMAEAMIVWNSNGGNPYSTRAVFIVDDEYPSVMNLVYSDGRFFDKNPIPIEFDSPNSNPSNDRHLARKLPEILDHIKQMHANS